MTFDQIFRQLHRSESPVAALVELRKAPTFRSGEDAQAAIVELKSAINGNRVGRALSAARALLVLVGPDKAIVRLKRAALLRASTFDFNARVIEKVLADWLGHAGQYGLSASNVAYLASAASLCRLAPSVRALYQEIVARLRDGRDVAIKSLLAEVDAAFAYSRPVDVGLGGEPAVTSEELAEAFSYLLRIFHANVGVAPRHFGRTDAAAGYDTRYRTLLGDALKVCRYREAEVLLEGFPFHAQLGSNGVRIASIDPVLEQSIRIGYVQTELQSNVHYHRLHSARAAGEIASLPVLADQFFGQYGNQVSQLKRTPVPRYTMELPMGQPMAQLFREDALFLEDISCFEALGSEEYIEPATVPHAVVAGSITVLDLLKVQRLFRFLHLGLLKALEQHVPFSEQAGLYMASCLPVFTRGGLIHILHNAVGEAKAPEILHLLTGDLTAPDLDIQYTPIISAGGYYMLSPAVLSRSNLPRNLLCKLRRRLVPPAPDRPDPMQSRLAQALRHAGFRVEEEINLTVGKNKLEVDLLAYRDGYIFIFECKNAYHPCNVYEMRNTYDVIVGAAGQLALRQAWLSDIANQRILFDKLAWDAPVPADVRTCIALGNRVFSGYRCEGHPVRQVHEMLNLLLRGYIEFENGDGVRLWEHESFTVNDLIAHLEGQTTQADMIDALVPVDVITPIGDTPLVYATYALDGERLKATVRARYPHVSFP